MDCQLDRLVRIFSTILAPTLIGCGATGGAEIDPTQFSFDLCGAEAEAGLLDTVEPAQPADYIELREAENFSDTEDGWSDPRIVDARGERCSGASDAQACSDAFDALSLDSEFYQSGFDVGTYQSVAFTRGDQVGTIGSRAALSEFLGPIDSPGDAALLARLDGHHFACDTGNELGERDDGYVIHTRTGGGCGESDDIEEHVILVHPDGSIEVIETVLIAKGDPNCSVGRLPAGLCRGRRVGRVGRAEDPVGTFFAEVAHLEAAAVTAFGQLARELTLHQAPRSMVAAARRSRADELRHARVTARLARRYGGRPVAPRVEPWAPRPLAEVAADNATEGCIRETYGALVAHAQARRASDPRVRRALGRIAHDETRHAALSWSLAQWAQARMSAPQRRRVAQQTRRALERLEHELTGAFDPRVHRIAGMPAPEQARSLYRKLQRSLFADAVV